jgi:hypothetical protein
MRPSTRAATREGTIRVFMMSKSAYLYDAGDHNGPHVMFFTALKDGMDWGLAYRARQFLLVLTGSYRRRNRPRRKGCRRFLCSQSQLQSGLTERSHPSIKSRRYWYADAGGSPQYSFCVVPRSLCCALNE